MRLLMEAMNGLGAMLLQVAALLALEELTFGGLVRLVMTSRPGAGKNPKQKHGKGEGQCSH